MHSVVWYAMATSLSVTVCLLHWCTGNIILVAYNRLLFSHPPGVAGVRLFTQYFFMAALRIADADIIFCRCGFFFYLFTVARDHDSDSEDLYFGRVITGSIARRAKRRYLSYTEADFEVVHPAAAQGRHVAPMGV